ncbi:MAG: PAS domain S-box protein [Candidatus Omnitrophica bacterium]|nr:PAS domain S-box protein [Candidatus Omnitrophota bacterium]
MENKDREIRQELNACRRDAEEVSRVNELCQTLLKTIPFGMEIVDEYGNILFMNEKFIALFGESAVGKKCWEVYKDNKEQCRLCPLKEGVRAGETRTIEISGALGGRTFLVSHTGMMYMGRKAVLEVFQDITTRKKAEKALRHTMKMKSDFVSMVSHELKTPLMVINEGSKLLASSAGNELKGADLRILERIRSSADNMMMLVNDVLSLQVMESGKQVFDIRPNDINRVVNEVASRLEPMSVDKGISLEKELDENIPEAGFDRNMIALVVTNLLTNAIKFTLEGSVRVSTSFDGMKITVSVQDTGVGIRKEDRKKLFEKFSRFYSEKGPRPEGTGLGLSISRKIVREHGGEIEVESEYGKGSTFSFSLPRG